MTTYSPTTAADLLRAGKDGITLADELQSALAHALDNFIGDNNLAVFAMSDDLLETLLPAVADLDLNDYVTEESHNEETAPEVAPSETAVEQILETNSADHPTAIARLHHRRSSTGVTYGTYAGDDLPMSDYVPVLVPASFIHATEPTRMMLSVDDVVAHDRLRIERERRRQIEREITRRMIEEFGQ